MFCILIVSLDLALILGKIGGFGKCFFYGGYFSFLFMITKSITEQEEYYGAGTQRFTCNRTSLGLFLASAVLNCSLNVAFGLCGAFA